MKKISKVKWGLIFIGLGLFLDNSNHSYTDDISYIREEVIKKIILTLVYQNVLDIC
ncbi:MAG: hypothetical protein HRT66_06330 [Flavobacteriaceae bacterium]|nr:hypothetical protein [Flavobacteriaceae bacterium]